MSLVRVRVATAGLVVLNCESVEDELDMESLWSWLQSWSRA